MREAADRKALVRLVRHLLSGPPCKAGRSEAGIVTLERVDGSARSFPETVLRKALSLGLALEEGPDRIAAGAPAGAFVRRALADPDGAFADQHRVLDDRMRETEEGRRRVQVNLAESPLAIVARLKEKSGDAFLPPTAIEAGERLHRDFTRAQLQPRLTVTYEPRLSARIRGGTGGAAQVSDSAMAARARVARAVEAIGPELCGVALDVCGFEKGLETVERERQWPARSAKLMLRAALMALARHYAPPPPQARRRHAWGAEGYRPDMDGGTDRGG